LFKKSILGGAFSFARNQEVNYMEIPIYCSYTELVDPETLVPNPRNPNQHPKKQIELLAKIIQSQGWRAPITVSNRSGFIVRGHGRLQAALLLGCQVPVDRQDYASEAEEWADLIADNRIAEFAEIDNDVMAKLLTELDGLDFDMNLTGYFEKQIDNLLADIRTEQVTDDDFDAAAAAEEITEPVSKLGDVWQLGDHRLMCGDSTKREDVQKLMDGKQAVMVFTDPPYNVDYQGATKDKLKIKNDHMPKPEFQQFLTSAFSCMYESTVPGGAIYVCHADSAGNDFRGAMNAAGWSIRQCLIWVKNQFVIGRQDYQWQHEPILYGWRPDGAHRFFGGRKQGTVFDDDCPVVIQDTETGKKNICITLGAEQIVLQASDVEIISKVKDLLMTTWRFEKPLRNGEHPTMKPIPLCARAIQNSSRPQEIALDSFGGSGSTLMAAEQTNRICYVMEFDPIYVDVIIRRWEKFTGKIAIKLS
jgi:DNA modification methylase